MTAFSSFTKWHVGVDKINNLNCFAINFGVLGAIPFPTFSLQTSKEVNLEKYELERKMKCFYVFVGGGYLNNMEQILETVDEISSKLSGIRPSAYFIIGHQRTITMANIPTNVKSATVKYLFNF